MAFLWSRTACDISSGILSILLTIYLNKEPSILVVEFSFGVAKAWEKHALAVPYPPA